MAAAGGRNTTMNTDVTQPDGAESFLTFIFKIVAGARQIVGVIVQMLIERSPETGVPVALEAEILQCGDGLGAHVRSNVDQGAPAGHEPTGVFVPWILAW